MFVRVKYFFFEVSFKMQPKSMLGGTMFRLGKQTSPYSITRSFYGCPTCEIVSFPEILSESLSYFIPGSNLIITVSDF